MPKRVSLFLLFILPYLATSQVTTGIVLFENGQYEEALTKFNQALEDPHSLKDKEHFNAWYYKGRALVQEYGIAVNSAYAKVLLQKSDYILFAGTSFLKAYELADSDALKSKVKLEFATVVPMLLQLGIVELNNRNALEAKEYFGNAKRIDQFENQPNAYMIYDFHGQAELSLKDSTAAANDFKTSITKYQNNLPKTPDFLIGYTFYRCALIHYMRGQIDPAISILQDGLRLLDSEKDRLAHLFADKTISQSQLEDGQIVYVELKSYLESFELDLYLNFDEKYDEALKKFEQAVKENPKNENKLLAYAILLEKTDLDAGFTVYKKVLDLNPNNKSAFFNAGANRINKGVEEAKLSNEESDFTRSMEHEEKMKTHFKEALPFMKKHHELNPTDRETLRALLQLTIQLEMMKEYQKYKEKERQL